MNFRLDNTTQGITAPLALQEIDTKQGTQTQNAYRAAIRQAPHLGGLAVVYNEINGYHSSPLGLGGSQVNFNPDRNHYVDAIQAGIPKDRLGNFSKLLRLNGITPSVNELMVVCLLHEIGHADDHANYIMRANGDVKAAFELANKVRASEIATLPLQNATSVAISHWDNNTDDYQTRMRDHGITDATWQELLQENLKAYAELPCEKVADNFALGVLATAHA